MQPDQKDGDTVLSDEDMIEKEFLNFLNNDLMTKRSNLNAK
jgi:hypothetical protein